MPHQPYTEVPSPAPDGFPPPFNEADEDFHPNRALRGASGGSHSADSSAQTVAPASSTTWYKGADMVRKVLIIVGVVILCLVGWKLYTNWRAAHPDLGSGAIVSNDPLFDGKARPIDKSNDTSFISPEGKRAQAANNNQVQQPNGNAPATDSFPPSAPENIKFTGTGKYQLYRQGNITYRLNTDNGEECIMFATDEEWQKPRVWQHGCNR